VRAVGGLTAGVHAHPPTDNMTLRPFGEWASDAGGLTGMNPLSD